ncbi:MAG: ribonuclease E/G [Rhodospirillales bacterium]
MTRRLTVLIDGLTAELRTAILDGDEPVRFSVHPPKTLPRVGDVFTGRLRALDHGGAFVDLGGGLDGFLPAAEGLGEGDLIAVEVRREGGQGKGCRLARCRMDGGKTPGLIEKGPSPAVTSIAALGPDDIDRIVVEGIETFRDLCDGFAALADRIKLHAAGAPLFDAFGIETELHAVTDPAVPLGRGGRLMIEETAACVAIDVDSGGETPGQANRAAAPVLAREILKRGLSGVVLVDPAGSNDRRHGFRMAETLGERLAETGIDGEVKGVTRAGLVEIVIRRERESVAATLRRLRSCAYAAVRAAHKTAMEQPGKPIAIRANVDLTELLARDTFRPERDAFEARHGVGLHLVTDDAMARGVFGTEEYR